jgi:hypothetical protein
MEITRFEFVTSTKQGVILMARDEPMLVQALIPSDVIDDYFKLTDATNSQRQTLILANLDALGRIATGKYARQESNLRAPPGVHVAYVRISLFDIESSGETIIRAGVDAG